MRKQKLCIVWVYNLFWFYFHINHMFCIVYHILSSISSVLWFRFTQKTFSFLLFFSFSRRIIHCKRLQTMKRSHAHQPSSSKALQCKANDSSVKCVAKIIYASVIYNAICATSALVFRHDSSVNFVHRNSVGSIIWCVIWMLATMGKESRRTWNRKQAHRPKQVDWTTKMTAIQTTWAWIWLQMRPIISQLKR